MASINFEKAFIRNVGNIACNEQLPNRSQVYLINTIYVRGYYLQIPLQKKQIKSKSIE